MAQCENAWRPTYPIAATPPGIDYSVIDVSLARVRVAAFPHSHCLVIWRVSVKYGAHSAGVGEDAAKMTGFRGTEVQEKQTAEEISAVYGRFRCPDGRIVRLGRTDFSLGSTAARLCAREPIVCRRRRRRSSNPAHRVQAVEENDRQEPGGGTGVEHPERLHARAETKGEGRSFEFKSSASLGRGEEVLKCEERPCGVFDTLRSGGEYFHQ